MSDDLVKRLREDQPVTQDMVSTLQCTLQDAAADRIEELEAELHLMKTSGVVEVAVRNPNVMEYIKHWEGRAETAEVKLAKAVEALEFYATQDVTYPNVGTVTFHGYDDNGRKARTTLAELKGEDRD